MKFLVSLTLLFIPSLLFSQINESVAPVSFNQFQISSEKKNIKGSEYLYVKVLKDNKLLFYDSVVTDIKNCTGFSFPEKQPFKEYFIFAKRERQNGRLYILAKTGDWAVIPGGTYWVAPKHKLLFILAERDLTNLFIYNLATMKTVIEKFNCDEFTGWYETKGGYYGRVEMECGNEPEKEKELTEWMNAVIVEQFDVKTNTLRENNKNAGEIERAKKLIKYASCK
jgi:hypothetical protein